MITPAPASTSTSNSADEQAMPPLSLTLILAATPSLGIGKNGTLPWLQLRKEMAYFRRVTTRVPPPPSNTAAPVEGRKRLNAVIMGRKTWDSIPLRFRPLSDRVNIVVTREPSTFMANNGKGSGEEGPIAVGSVKEAVDRLRSYNTGAQTKDEKEDVQVEIERVFVIGGATIYEQALGMPETERVLLTRVEEEFECDTFFKVDLEGEEGWRRCGGEEVDGWTGEEKGTGSEVVEEKGVRFGFGMYERVR